MRPLNLQRGPQWWSVNGKTDHSGASWSRDPPPGRPTEGARASNRPLGSPVGGPLRWLAAAHVRDGPPAGAVCAPHGWPQEKKRGQRVLPTLKGANLKGPVLQIFFERAERASSGASSRPGTVALGPYPSPPAQPPPIPTSRAQLLGPLALLGGGA